MANPTIHQPLDITQRIVTAYIHAELFQRRKYLQATTSRHVETLKAYINWLMQKGYIDHANNFNYTFKHLYKRDSDLATKFQDAPEMLLSQYISLAQFEDLLANVFGKSVFVRERDRLVLMFGYYCGLRAAEVLALNANIIVEKIKQKKLNNHGLFATTEIAIIGKGNKRRLIFIPPIIGEKIVNFTNSFPQLLTKKNTPLVSSMTYKPIKNKKHASIVFSNACKKSSSNNVVSSSGFHRLRKTFATNETKRCHEEGDDPMVIIPRLLGHVSPTTTLKYILFEALISNRSKVLRALSLNQTKYGFLLKNKSEKDAHAL